MSNSIKNFFIFMETYNYHSNTISVYMVFHGYNS